MDNVELQEAVFNIQRFCIQDGPGIRTTIFLKGCPLRCLWCSNPESHSQLPEIGFLKDKCNGCGDCVPVCPEGVIILGDGAIPHIIRGRCNTCGICVEACPKDALTIHGSKLTVEEVFGEVMKDKAWYGSDGGLTVSGGEPLIHLSFVVALFKLCREAGVSTCIETSGYVSSEALQTVLGLTDVVLFDLKHMDHAEHEKLTGVKNHLILDNARAVAKSRTNVQFRMPLIPGLNSSPDNIRATSQFLRELMGDKASIELMPYHSLGKGKWEAVGKDYPLKELALPDIQFIRSIRDSFEEEEIACSVSQ